MNTIALVSYSLLWVFAFYSHQRQTKYFGAGSAILLMFLIYSLISFYLFSISDSSYRTIRLVPFIYLFVCIIIASYPVLKYNEAEIKTIIPTPPIYIHVFTYIYLFCALIRIPEIISSLSSGITLILLDVDAGQDLYDNAHLISNTSGISNIFAIIYNVFADASIILFFYYWIFFPNRKITIIIFAISIIIQVLTQVSMGLRTETVLKALSVVIAYITMRRFMNAKQKRKSLIIGGVFIGLVLAAVIAVSFSRFDNNESVGIESGTLGYIGMGNLVFNEDVWYVNGTRNGDRTANTFKVLLGYKDVPKNIEAVRSKYSSLGVDDSVFYTFVGDFVLDYGLFLTPLIFMFFSIIFRKITKAHNHYIKLHQLIALFFVMNVVVQGGFYLFSYSFSNNLVILGYIALYLYFWVADNSKQTRKCLQ